MSADTPDHTSADHFVSDRAAGLWLSGNKEMAMLSARIDGAASLAWGVPSFATPEYISNGFITRLKSDSDIGKYALPDGLDELKQLVARKHKLGTGISVDADKHVMTTAIHRTSMSKEHNNPPSFAFFAFFADNVFFIEKPACEKKPTYS